MEVQSQFIEMFGGEKYPLVRLGQYTNLNWGDTKTTKASYVLSGYQAYSASGPDGLLDHYDYDCEGIVLSAIGADCGKTWFAKGKWSCIKNTIRFWSISNELDNAFLFFATNKKEFWPRRGGAQPFIPQGDARNCTIPLPPMDQQQQFVSIAEQADKSKFVGFKSQFIEMMGDLPKNGTLSDYCEMKAGKSIKSDSINSQYNDGLYPCYGGNGLRGYVETYSHDGVYNIIGRQGALCGNITLTKGKFYATEHAIVVRPKTPINEYWLYFALAQMNLNQYARGVAQPGLAVKQLEKLPFGIPSKGKQEKFAAVYQQADKSKLTGHCLICVLNKGISKLIN